MTTAESTAHLGSILDARNVSKTYTLGRVDVPVLRGVTLSVREGEWVAILGASGSGKSTLMHILGGLDRPDSSKAHGNSEAASPCTVQFRGTELSTLRDSQLDRYRNQSVGFVFQFYHLLPELNVLENTLLPTMTRHGNRGGYPTERAEELLETFGLSHRLRHRPAELSGGERQRTAIARALINDPPLLLADEPTGNLDRKTGESILDAVGAFRAARKRTLVMVTHDTEVAARADRIVHLVDGQIVAG